MIKHVKADIFTTDCDIIVHQVNCYGVMGAGLAKQVKEKYPDVYDIYKSLCNNVVPEVLLGTTLMVQINDALEDSNKKYIANFFSQESYGYGKQFTSYEAFKKCLEYLKDRYSDYSIAFPYLIGCKRGGGDWNKIYGVIEEILGDCDVTIYEHDLG